MTTILQSYRVCPKNRIQKKISIYGRVELCKYFWGAKRNQDSTVSIMFRRLLAVLFYGNTPDSCLLLLSEMLHVLYREFVSMGETIM